MGITPSTHASDVGPSSLLNSVSSSHSRRPRYFPFTKGTGREHSRSHTVPRCSVRQSPFYLRCFNLLSSFFNKSSLKATLFVAVFKAFWRPFIIFLSEANDFKMRFVGYSKWKGDTHLSPGWFSGCWRCRAVAHTGLRSCLWESNVASECERSQPVMDAMADARVKVVISVLRAPWKRARYTALIGPTVAGLFAAAQLWLAPPWKCMPYAQRKLGE